MLSGLGIGARDLADMAVNLPREGAVSAALDPEGARWWTPDTYLLAHIADTLSWANWQRAGKGPKPKPTPRPGDTKTDTETIRGGSHDIAEFDAWYREQFPDRASALGSAPSNAHHPTNGSGTDSADPDTTQPAEPRE